MTVQSYLPEPVLQVLTPEGISLQRSRGGYRLWSEEARYAPSHFSGDRISDKRTHVATYEEHGVWMARVFALDPTARIKSAFGDYRGADSFHEQTNHEFGA